MIPVMLAIEFYEENGYSHAKKSWNEDDINTNVYQQTDEEKSVQYLQHAFRCC